MRGNATRFIRRWFLKGVLAVVDHPKSSLAIGGALLVGCILLAFYHLRISTESNELFSHKVPFFRDYLAFSHKFPENDAAYVVIEAKDPTVVPPIARWTAIADQVAARLRSLPQAVESVDERIPLDQLGKQGILFQDSSALKGNVDQARDFLPLARLWGEAPGLLTRFLGANPTERFLASVTTQVGNAEAVGLIQLVGAGLNDALSRPREPLKIGQQIPDLRSLGETDPQSMGYYYVPDEQEPTRSILLIKVFERSDYSGLSAGANVIGVIRSAVDEIAVKFPEFNAGLTGRPVLDADENEITDRDSRRSEIVALVAVFIGLMLLLRSAWLALASEISLAVGIGWTFGYATLSVGRLNLLSTVFLIALIGIGMDYLVQILSRYRQEAARHASPRVIWTAVFSHVGPPITTACFGAAAAFLVSAFTDFRGAAELGIIAGGGLLLCLLAGYTVLPALLALFPPAVRRDDANRVTATEAPSRASRYRLLLPLCWMVLLAVAIPFAFKTRFNPNLLDLQAPNLQSVQLVHKLQTWSAVVLSEDLNVLRAARKTLAGASTVAGTDSLLTAEDNYQYLQGVAPTLSMHWVAPAPVLPERLQAIATHALALADALERVPSPSTVAKTAAIDLRKFAKLLTTDDSGFGVAQKVARLSAWQTGFVDEMKDLLGQFNAPPMDLKRLPSQLRDHYVSRDGTYALYINPKGNLWKQENLAAFETEIESRVAAVPQHPTLTGVTSDIFHSTRAIENSFYIATGYALAIILVLVFIDLRRLDQTLLAVSVLGLGLPMLLGLMGLLGISWNFANFFGLPILIGAGHEYGVFMVHRYREACGDARRAWRWGDASDRALLLCAYVTSSSFGFFWALGHHRGLRSLGLVMALGTGCIYLAAVVVLRPILRWRLESRWHNQCQK